MNNIRDLLLGQGKQYGDKPFLIFPERDETISYAQMAERCSRTANLLLSLGIQPGDKVALLLPNIPEFLYFYWGAMLVGAVACPVNTLLKGSEIQFIADNAEAQVLVTTSEFIPEVNKIVGDLPQVRHYILVPDAVAGEAPVTESLSKTVPKTLRVPAPKQHAFSDLLPQQPSDLAPMDLPPDTEAMIIYTSGTTGKPKGVLLTHHNLLMDARYIRDWFHLTPETRMMCILPLFHVNGEVVTMMTPLVTGTSVVLNRKFSVTNFWDYIARYHVHMFSTVPTILSILLSKGKPSVDYSSLQFGICGAAPLPVEVHEQFEATFNVPIYEGYGLSETTCYSTFNPPDPTQRKIGSIGVAVGNEVAIWDAHNQPLPDGECGEIVIRGENVMKGYFKRPEANEEAFAGGWFHSGDLGMRDADGFYFILDRKKDMIIRGGENIYPREIDEALYKHPKIEAAATIGIPDDKYGEEVKSYVVIKPGETLTEAEVLAYCREHLADFKCPKFVSFIDEIPKGPTGKLLRRALRDQDAADKTAVG